LASEISPPVPPVRGEPLRRLRILDTTLRDGDQAAGFAFTVKQKISLAHALAEAGIDTIETGFPLSSPSDFEVCRELAREFPGRTAVMCRGRREDIAETAKVFGGGRPGILHISLPVSKIHIEAKLGKTEGELLRLAGDLAAYAGGFVEEIELGAEDATRAEREFLLDYCGIAARAGVKTVNIADTLGLSSPGEFAGLVSFLKKGVPAFGKTLAESPDGAALSVHCHNDFGLAGANTLAAVEAGCDQVELSVSGIGERAGNAALEEVYLNLKARPGLYRAETGIVPEKLKNLVALVSEFSGASFSPMKPVSGWNARSHGSGIHQHGLSRKGETYSSPVLESLGLSPERIVLSRHSGLAGLRLFARRYCGFEPDTETGEKLLDLVKAAPAPLTGLTEFLSMAADLDALPPDYPRPLVCRSFEGTFSTGAGTDPAYNFRAAVASHGVSGSFREASGAGETEALAALDLSCRLTGRKLRFARIGLSGGGSRIRLYAEILGQDSQPEAVEGKGEIAAFERIGPSAGLLLFQCCLDAVNGCNSYYSSRYY
jgi:2-isopropylmalate synthase